MRSWKVSLSQEDNRFYEYPFILHHKRTTSVLRKHGEQAFDKCVGFHRVKIAVNYNVTGSKSAFRRLVGEIKPNNFLNPNIDFLSFRPI
jgi:hypothetical protein